MPGYSLLLGVLVAAPAMAGARSHPASLPVVELNDHAASKLLIRGTRPHYPPIARVNYIQGSVKLHVTVDPRGRVSVVHVIKGQPLLAAAAIRAVRKWIYRPYHSSGGDAPFSTYVVLKFFLHPHRFLAHLPMHADAFLARQIHPPEAVCRHKAGPPLPSVRFRVLVGSRGEVLDATPLKANVPDLKLARENLGHWKFRPARWGALAVPWYVTVKVPVYRALPAEADNAAGK